MNDLARVVGIRAPSLYNHVASKHDLLREIMVETMDQLIAGFHGAVASAEGVTEQLRRATETHIRYHTRHRREAFVGNREIWSLEPSARRLILVKRKEYSMLFRRLIEQGRSDGLFAAECSRLPAFAILDMGIGVAAWFRSGGPVSDDEVARSYGEFALRLAVAGEE